MNVLSLFDGMSCGRIALERAGIPVTSYHAAEIDKWAIKIAKKNYPDTIHLGDVRDVFDFILPDIDLLIGGSPCQGFSFAGKMLNFDDPRSKLFFEFVRLKEELKPRWFLLENVKMKKESQAIISKYLGVEPIEINSALVSAQNRRRLYWTNIPFDGLPEDRCVLVKDILEYPGIPVVNDFGVISERSKVTCLNANYFKGMDNKHARTGVKYYLSEDDIKKAKERYSSKTWKSGNKMGGMKFPDGVNRKSKTLNTSNALASREAHHLNDGYGIRRLTPIECERLQTVPDNYTEGVSDTQRYRMLGNGWTVDVIAHFFKGLI